MESVLKQVGLAEDDSAESDGGSPGRKRGKGKGKGKERVWLHCNVGGSIDEKVSKAKEEGDEVG